MVLAASGVTPSLGAEDAAGPGGAELPSIEVTASKLPGAPPLSPTPLFIVDHEALVRSGAMTLDEVLQHIPAFGFQGVNQNQNAGGYGVSFLDLRNLNFNRTLVLIDGRRVVLSGIQTDEAVDVANIPLAMVERVEVLPSGSAPQYGADAVAGVVNIVLKRDLTGLSVTAGSGISGRADASAADGSVTYGLDLPGGHFSLGASWMHRDPLPQSSRAWAQDPITAAGFGHDGSLIEARGSEATLAGRAVGPNLVGAAGDDYDPSTAAYLRGGLQRATLDALGREEIGGVAAFMEFGFSDKLATTQLSPQILGLSGTAKHPDGFVIPADNPFNPYGEDVTLQRVLSEVGDQRSRSRNQVLRVVAGLEGTGWAGLGWTVSINHGESRTTYDVSNAVNLSRALQTVSSDPADCPASEGCVAADYFAAGGLSPAAAAYLRYDDLTASEYRENELQASVDGALDILRGGPAKATLGAEYRREYGQTIPSLVVLDGDQAGGDAAVTTGAYSTRELFLNVDLPLLRSTPSQAPSLDAQASARHVSTTLFGAFTVWKLDASWAPVDYLALRAGLGTARRVPAITEAFGGSTTSPLDITDPCDSLNGLLANPVVAANCRSLGLGPTFRQSSALLSVANGGNPHLKPEASRSYDVGLRFTPGVDASLSLDYYNIAVHDAIDSLTDAAPDYIANTCFSSPNLSSALCHMITRIPNGPSTGQISRIDAPDENIGAIETDGVDLDLVYGMALPPGATLRLQWETSWLLDYRVQEAPGAVYIQEAGTFPNLSSAGSLTRYKSVLTPQYETAAWTASWSVRYLGGARVLGESSSTPFSRASGIFYHDLSVACRIAPATLTFGVDNLTNQRPPTLIDGVSNTNLNTYDVIGRFFFARASWTW